MSLNDDFGRSELWQAARPRPEDVLSEQGFWYYPEIFSRLVSIEVMLSMKVFCPFFIVT
jgi:hypothetical protein